MAAGGIISLLRSLPTIWSSLLEGLKDFRGGAAARPSLLRTERDLSMKVVVFGSLALVVAIMLAPPLHMNVVGAVADRRPRVPVRDGVVAADRRDRIVVEPDFRA